MPHGRLPLEVLRSRPMGRRPWETPDTLQGSHLPAPPEGDGNCWRLEEVWAACDPNPGTAEENGWIDGG